MTELAMFLTMPAFFEITKNKVLIIDFNQELLEFELNLIYSYDLIDCNCFRIYSLHCYLYPQSEQCQRIKAGMTTQTHINNQTRTPTT